MFGCPVARMLEGYKSLRGIRASIRGLTKVNALMNNWWTSGTGIVPVFIWEWLRSAQGRLDHSQQYIAKDTPEVRGSLLLCGAGEWVAVYWMHKPIGCASQFNVEHLGCSGGWKISIFLCAAEECL